MPLFEWRLTAELLQTPLAIEIIQTLIARSSRPGQLTPMHGCLLEVRINKSA